MNVLRLLRCWAGVGWVAFAVGAARAADAPAPAAASAAGELHALAQELWDEHAPAAVKAEYELISAEEMTAWLNRIAAAGRDGDLAAFAAHAPETRAALAAIRGLPEFADYAEWAGARLDEMEVAGEALAAPALVPAPTPEPPKPAPAPAPSAPAWPKLSGVPFYELWQTRLANRRPPERAEALLPVVKAAFAAEGVPVALAWLAEVESGFNPRAQSPAGAKGLFQLMPGTARALGLSLLPFDQRTEPARSARAAAGYLRKLHTRFGDWPLALAAYNAGEGRVARTLKAEGAKDFAGIVGRLPPETRLYVPKVLATVRVREGVDPGSLAAPGLR
jgi:membrane-bound lytic murein transglycosylase D